MGSSSISYPLIATRAKVGTNAAVRTAITTLLYGHWSLDNGAWRTISTDWIGTDDTALMQIQLPDELRAPATSIDVWFDGVAWPAAFAEHLVEYTFAYWRREVEVALARLGLAIDPAGWPRLERVLADRFVVHADKLGRLDEGDDEVTWWTTDGDHVRERLDDLPPDVRARLAAPAACECPACARHADQLRPPVRALAPHRATRVHGWYRAAQLLAPRGGGLLFVGQLVETWTQRTVGGDAPWTTVVELSHPARSIDLIHSVGDTHVAVFGTRTGKPRVASVSRDGGATWSEPAPTGLPAIKGSHLAAHAHRPSIVHAIAPASKGAPPRIHRSGDGGRSFGEPIVPMLDGAPFATLSDVIAFDDRTLAIGSPSKKASPSLSIAADGAAFASRALPGFTFGLAATSPAGAVALFGTRGGAPVALRSRDRGKTWDERPAPNNVVAAVLGGRWFVAERYVGIHVSDDDGATWALVIEGDFHALAPDGADPSSVYALAKGVAYHVTI